MRNKQKQKKLGSTKKNEKVTQTCTDRSIYHKILASTKPRAITTFHTGCSVTLYTQVAAAERAPTPVRALEHSNHRSSVHVLSATTNGDRILAIHAQRSACRQAKHKKKGATQEAPTITDTDSASSEDYIGGDTRARQQATRQHLTGERCARVKRPLPTNGH